MPTSIVNFHRATTGYRMALLFITIVNGTFTVISMACAALIMMDYANFSEMQEGHGIPSERNVGSAHDSRDDVPLRKTAVAGIRSAPKRGRRNPLLVSTGLFVVAGILTFSLVWFFLEEKLHITARVKRLTKRTLVRLRLREDDGQEAQDGEEHGEEHGIVLQDLQGQVSGIQNQGRRSEGDVTLAYPLAEPDLEAQSHIVHAPVVEESGDRRKPPEGQGQNEQTPSESALTLHN